MIEVPLSNSDRVALIDDSDEALVCAHRWWMIESRSPGRPSFYARGSVIGERFHPLMHRLLAMGITDHVNGNGLDNRRANLRPATRSQNGANRRKVVKTASSFKGVTRYAVTRWRAYITKDQARIHLGVFESELSAASAYDCAARELFGEYAALNFPQAGERSALSAA